MVPPRKMIRGRESALSSSTNSAADGPSENAAVTWVAEQLRGDWLERSAPRRFGRALRTAAGERVQPARAVVAAFARWRSGRRASEAAQIERYSIQSLLLALARSGRELSDEDGAAVVEAWRIARGDDLWVDVDDAILAWIERATGRESIRANSPRLAGALEELAEPLAATERDRAVAAEVRRLLATGLERILSPGPAWVADAATTIERARPEVGAAWLALLEHAGSRRSASPSAAWTKTASAMLRELAPPEFEDGLARWLSAWERESARADPNDDRHRRVLRGLVWMAKSRANARLCRVLARCAETSRRRDARGSGSLAGAALAALEEWAMRPAEEPPVREELASKSDSESLASSHAPDASAAAVVELTRLATRVSHRSFRRRIERALSTAAERRGVARAELEELATPDFGLTGVGTLAVEIGGCIGRLSIAPTARVTEGWERPGGRVLGSVPADARSADPDGVARFRERARTLRGAASAVRDRLESLLVSARSWELEAWRQRYLVQPLVGAIAQNLIWAFRLPDGVRLGIPRDGKLVDVSGERLYGFRESTEVRLWHPIGCAADAVGRWRDVLVEEEITQPFKQAFREVYVLTDAELRTRLYSNRFAGHIVKQHQFARLAKARGWEYSLAGRWTFGNGTAAKILPEWGIRAEFWVDPIRDDDAYSDRGAALYLSTDQVRFARTDAPDAELELLDVPALVFTEVMRDVDLFVGVASIGSDPGWTDGALAHRFGDYWRGFSFGALTEAAQSRRELLARLLPRLEVGRRSRIDGRFLVVRGDLRTYKIHLGSGNVLMEPNDQYLCIVEDRGAGSSVPAARLPYEGDPTLSLILSKAILLADDRSIRDATIRQQIRDS